MNIKFNENFASVIMDFKWWFIYDNWRVTEEEKDLATERRNGSGEVALQCGVAALRNGEGLSHP